MTLIVAGLGSIGRRHLCNLRLLLPDARLVVLRRPASSVETPPPEADRVVFALEDALAEDPEAALVCGPAPTHVAMGAAFTSRGVPVLVEKPLADGLTGVDAFLAEARARGVVVAVGYNLRFLEPLRLLRDAVVRGAIGRPVALRAEVGQYLPSWRPEADFRTGVSARAESGGGAVLELSHELDYACWILGDVAEVSGHLGTLGDWQLDVEDVAEIVLRFRSGALGSVHLDMIRRPAARACRVVGTAGTVEWDGETHRVRLYDAAAERWTDLREAGPVDRNAMYLDELRDFLGSVRERREPLVTGEEARRALAVALAVKTSAREGRVVAP